MLELNFEKADGLGISYSCTQRSIMDLNTKSNLNERGPHKGGFKINMYENPSFKVPFLPH